MRVISVFVWDEDCSATSLYARIHSSTVMPSLLSMILMILWGSISDDDLGASYVQPYPPVLMPLINSDWSQGVTIQGGSKIRAEVMQVAMVATPGLGLGRV